MKTLAKALRDRKTLMNNLKVDSQRAEMGAVSLPGQKPDFITKDYLKKFKDDQVQLRTLKTDIAAKTLSTLVLIPENICVPESGKRVPLFQAILIRDDLKARKQLSERLIAIPIKENRWNRLTGQEEGEVKDRHFDMEEVIAGIDNLQGQIDIVDALVQYNDNTVEI